MLKETTNINSTPSAEIDQYLRSLSQRKLEKLGRLNRRRLGRDSSPSSPIRFHSFSRSKWGAQQGAAISKALVPCGKEDDCAELQDTDEFIETLIHSYYGKYVDAMRVPEDEKSSLYHRFVTSLLLNSDEEHEVEEEKKEKTQVPRLTDRPQSAKERSRRKQEGVNPQLYSSVGRPQSAKERLPAPVYDRVRDEHNDSIRTSVALRPDPSGNDVHESLRMINSEFDGTCRFPTRHRDYYSCGLYIPRPEDISLGEAARAFDLKMTMYERNRAMEEANKYGEINSGSLILACVLYRRGLVGTVDEGLYVLKHSTTSVIAREAANVDIASPEFDSLITDTFEKLKTALEDSAGTTKTHRGDEMDKKKRKPRMRRGSVEIPRHSLPIQTEIDTPPSRPRSSSMDLPRIKQTEMDEDDDASPMAYYKAWKFLGSIKKERDVKRQSPERSLEPDRTCSSVPSQGQDEEASPVIFHVQSKDTIENMARADDQGHSKKEKLSIRLPQQVRHRPRTSPPENRPRRAHSPTSLAFSKATSPLGRQNISKKRHSFTGRREGKSPTQSDGYGFRYRQAQQRETTPRSTIRPNVVEISGQQLATEGNASYEADRMSDSWSYGLENQGFSTNRFSKEMLMAKAIQKSPKQPKEMLDFILNKGRYLDTQQSVEVRRFLHSVPSDSPIEIFGNAVWLTPVSVGSAGHLSWEVLWKSCSLRYWCRRHWVNALLNHDIQALFQSHSKDSKLCFLKALSFSYEILLLHCQLYLSSITPSQLVNHLKIWCEISEHTFGKEAEHLIADMTSSEMLDSATHWNLSVLCQLILAHCSSARLKELEAYKSIYKSNHPRIFRCLVALRLLSSCISFFLKDTLDESAFDDGTAAYFGRINSKSFGTCLSATNDSWRDFGILHVGGQKVTRFCWNQYDEASPGSDVFEMLCGVIVTKLQGENNNILHLLEHPEHYSEIQKKSRTGTVKDTLVTKGWRNPKDSACSARDQTTKADSYTGRKNINDVASSAEDQPLETNISPGQSDGKKTCNLPLTLSLRQKGIYFQYAPEYKVKAHHFRPPKAPSDKAPSTQHKEGQLVVTNGNSPRSNDLCDTSQSQNESQTLEQNTLRRPNTVQSVRYQTPSRPQSAKHKPKQEGDMVFNKYGDSKTNELYTKPLRRPQSQKHRRKCVKASRSSNIDALVNESQKRRQDIHSSIFWFSVAKAKTNSPSKS